MAKASPLTSEEAARCFVQVFRAAGVSPKNPSILKGWTAFREFCGVTIERTGEGFIFNAGFRPDFPPPDHKRVLDYSAYEVAFLRYWSEKGDVSDTTHFAECKFTIGDHPVLRSHEWVDVEIDADGDETRQRSQLERFVKKVEAFTDLWNVLRVASPIGMYSYAGPR